MYKEFIKSVLAICKDKSIKVNYKIINEFRLYYITLNGDKPYDKTIVFSAGIHGNEIAGPHAVLKFLKEYKEIAPNKRVIFLPVVNPYGFNKCIRYNALNQDINRRFCDRCLTGEAKTIYRLLRKIKPNLFVSLHEWEGDDGYFMWCSDAIKKDTLEGIPEIAKKYFKIFTNQRINNEDVNKGIIWHPIKNYKVDSSKCTLENKMYMNGIHYICTETPSKADIDKRVSCKLEIMNYILEKYY